MVSKAKIRKIAKIYYILKATNGETQARIKKMIEKRKRTTTGSLWAPSFFSCRKQIYVKLCTALEGEQGDMVQGYQVPTIIFIKKQ